MGVILSLAAWGEAKDLCIWTPQSITDSVPLGCATRNGAQLFSHKMPQRRFKLDQPLTFDEALRRVANVTPAELKRREAAERQARAERKAARKKLAERRAVGRAKRVSNPSTLHPE